MAALSVGVFPYVLHLLQVVKSDPPIPLLSLCAKILSTDQTAQLDLLKNDRKGLRNLTNKISGNILGGEEKDSLTLTLFCLACATFKCPETQNAALKADLMPAYCVILNEPDSSPSLIRHAALAILSLTELPGALDLFNRSNGVDIVISRIKRDYPVCVRLALLALACRFAHTLEGASLFVQYLNDPAPCIRRIVLGGLVIFGMTHYLRSSEYKDPQISGRRSSMLSSMSTGQGIAYDRVWQGICQLTDDTVEEVASAAAQYAATGHINGALVYGPNEVLQDAMAEVANAACYPYWNDKDYTSGIGDQKTNLLKAYHTTFS
ncbi:hypothetical protein ACOME3_001171 [Neoechinorhynchus agilis]